MGTFYKLPTHANRSTGPKIKYESHPIREVTRQEHHKYDERHQLKINPNGPQTERILENNHNKEIQSER